MANKKDDGYWFSLENGTHIHVGEGETPKEATEKALSKVKKGQGESKKSTKYEKQIDELKEQGYLSKDFVSKGNEAIVSDAGIVKKNYDIVKEQNLSLEEAKERLDRIISNRGEGSPEAEGVKKYIKELSETNNDFDDDFDNDFEEEFIENEDKNNTSDELNKIFNDLTKKYNMSEDDYWKLVRTIEKMNKSFGNKNKEELPF